MSSAESRTRAARAPTRATESSRVYYTLPRQFAKTNSPTGQVIRHCLSALTAIGTSGISRLPAALLGLPIVPHIYSPLCDVDSARVEIDVAPAKPAQLARAHSGEDCGNDKGAPTVRRAIDQKL